MDKIRIITIKWISIFILSFIFLCVSCNNDKKNKSNSLSDKELKEKLIEVNRSRVGKEKSAIDNKIENLGWEMTQTGTGLRYQVYSTENGDSIKLNQVVEVKFVISLLNNDTLYTSEESGTEFFKVGMDHVETGIHEVITHLRVGDKAHVILPAHLAHGFIGDNQKIPSNVPIIYDLQILSVQ